MTTEIKLKPGKQSTEFYGKVVLQVVLFINMLLGIFKLPALDVSPEMTISIAGGIEALWLMFRQLNKNKELTIQQKVKNAESNEQLGEAIQAANGLQSVQMNLESQIKSISGQMEELKKELTKPGM